MVGVQPFGGSGLSGTGPKAGGPLYLGRLLRSAPANALAVLPRAASAVLPARAFIDWLRAEGEDEAANACLASLSRSTLGAHADLPGPAGERNTYTLRPRGRVAAVAATWPGLLLQLGAILATANDAIAVADDASVRRLRTLPPAVAVHVAVSSGLDEAGLVNAALVEGDYRDAAARLAAREGPIVPLQVLAPDAIAAGETSTSICCCGSVSFPPIPPPPAATPA